MGWSTDFLTWKTHAFEEQGPKSWHIRLRPDCDALSFFSTALVTSFLPLFHVARFDPSRYDAFMQAYTHVAENLNTIYKVTTPCTI